MKRSSLWQKALLVVVVLVFFTGLIVGAIWFPAQAARSVSPRRCLAIGGVWQSDVIGHGGYCDTTGITHHHHPQAH